MEIKEPYGFIYITTNMVNGKRYIGQKKFIDGWKCYLGSGKAFKKAVKKYGRYNFVRDIVAIAYNKEELDKLEIEFIKNHNASNERDYYNICCGGSGVKTNSNQVFNCRKVVCLNNKTVYTSCTEASKTFDIDISSIGGCCSGRNLSGGKKDNIPLVWMYFEEYIKLSDDEIKSKIDLALSTRKFGDNYNSQKVICTTTGKIFNSITEGANYYNCLRSHVSSCCNHKRKHCGKLQDGTRLTWMYYDEYINSFSDELNRINIFNDSIKKVKKAGKKVICVTTGKTFNSAKNAGDFYNIDASAILKCCKGKAKTAKKLIWSFA